MGLTHETGMSLMRRQESLGFSLGLSLKGWERPLPTVGYPELPINPSEQTLRVFGIVPYANDQLSNQVHYDRRGGSPASL
ncbi:hypothetical protein DIC66_05480 [Rhodoferax lacus]|uniref:Uncharacterized protein n=1 Tax=Rhodoferax lacus TaxID=2184758 RepID=A0A3E1RFK8_9BURK|nr:hypothetical protein DIC66_05480 [Rhodoferax lacus]